MFLNYLVIGFISCLCICLELFFTRILNLKSWNHLVYIIIPYAILGYSIGANVFLILEKTLQKIPKQKVIGCILAFICLTTIACTYLLARIPILIGNIQEILVNPNSILMLLAAYTVVMIPFIFIGFLVVYLFNTYFFSSTRLYFVDLTAAGLGAILFYFLINSFQVIHSILALSLVGLFIAVLILYPRLRYITTLLFVVGSSLVLYLSPERIAYFIDLSKGWEVIPGYYKAEDYQRIVSRWHPLGRTDIYRIINPEAEKAMYDGSLGTFEINVSPLPELSYITTNYLAGSPIYRLNADYLNRHSMRVEKFSQPMEFPYSILNRPRVLVIGTGGGRDIFMARTHDAEEILGAEINPGIYKEMMPGGAFYDYSGNVYNLPHTHIFNIDGRQLVKHQKNSTIDLIILNGVDTFSGLSSGAYAYAESYLYTKEAIIDYLRILNNNGVVNFNRWFFANIPREDLRLFGLALYALRDMNIKNPEEHIIIGAHHLWAMILVKKTPFTADERETIKEYFKTHDTSLLFPLEDPEAQEESMFHIYVNAFNEYREKEVERAYPFDISVVTDDAPFFYKYYKLNSFNPFKVSRLHHTGGIVFMTQALVFLQAVIFILLFIFFPLYIFKKRELLTMSVPLRREFIIYFSSLGLGFMFIEIPLMQWFVLFLGSPIYSISVVLAALLISTGIGSLLSPYLEKLFGNKVKMIYSMTIILIILMTLLILMKTYLFNLCIDLPFILKIGAIIFCLLPVGIILGIYFPSGLLVMGKEYKDSIAWAWAINGGFTVLGSILSIIFAQFFGFTAILALACLMYMIASSTFRKMSQWI